MVIFANCSEKVSSLWSDRAAPNRSEIVLSKFKQHAWKMGRNVNLTSPIGPAAAEFLRSK